MVTRWVIGAANTLALGASEPVVLPDPFWPQYELTKDIAAFADQYSAFYRAFSEPALFSVLDPDRSAADQ